MSNLIRILSNAGWCLYRNTMIFELKIAQQHAKTLIFKKYRKFVKKFNTVIVLMPRRFQTTI